jgi:hypothetical protein
MRDLSELKAVTTVADMARMVGLSRSRFYQLQAAGVFPSPVYDLVTRRPIYTEEQQRVCLEVRRRNCGVNGKPVLFYNRSSGASPVAPRRPRKGESVGRGVRQHPELLAALATLGLAVTARQVDQAVVQLFPQGTAGTDEGSLIRALYLHFRRQNSGDNVGR